MRAIGIFLMIISGALDIVSIAMIGNSSFKNFQTVLVISSSAFFVGLLMTIFGKPTTNPGNNSSNTNAGGYAGSTNSRWQCSNCGEWNSNAVYSCTRCGERKTTRSAVTVIKAEPGANEWKCYRCGRINQNYVGTCGCGMERQNNTKDVTAQNAGSKTSATQNANEWVCTNCGRINQNYVGTCGCGMTKQNNNANTQTAEVSTADSQHTIDDTGNSPFSTADEIKKYKQLLDMGAITQDEYDQKKAELLGLH